MSDSLPPLTSEGALRDGGEAWVGFLSRLGQRTEQRFVARNFLLDEGIPRPRVESYGEFGAMADHGTWETWQGLHSSYLEERVFRPPADDGLPETLDPADALTCPEPFRFLDPESRFPESDRRRHLIRVERLDFLARYGGESLDRVRALMLSATEHRNQSAIRRLDSILETWSKQVQARPAFAAFLDDVEEIVGLTLEEAPPSWADDLRDCLGLFHYDPGSRLPGREGEGIEIAVFRYEVGEVPRLRGVKDRRPLAAPTVLDNRPSPAFLPAPRGSLTGHVVDLSGKASNPRREIVHPSLPYRAKHLWRLGRIVRPVDASCLEVARGLHLNLVRIVSGRDDYARGTDGDLQ